jgi:hypothetical protein
MNDLHRIEDWSDDAPDSVHASTRNPNWDADHDAQDHCYGYKSDGSRCLFPVFLAE